MDASPSAFLDNYRKDAKEFLNTVLPSDFEGKLKDFAVRKKYTNRQFIYFFYEMVKEAIRFRGEAVCKKHYQAK